MKRMKFSDTLPQARWKSYSLLVFISENKFIRYNFCAGEVCCRSHVTWLMSSRRGRSLHDLAEPITILIHFFENKLLIKRFEKMFKLFSFTHVFFTPTTPFKSIADVFKVQNKPNEHKKNSKFSNFFSLFQILFLNVIIYTLPVHNKLCIPLLIYQIFSEF